MASLRSSAPSSLGSQIPSASESAAIVKMTRIWIFMIAFIMNFALLVKLFFSFFMLAAGQMPRANAAMMEGNRSRHKFFLLKSEEPEFSPNLNGHLSLFRSECALMTHYVICDGVRCRNDAFVW